MSDIRIQAVRGVSPASTDNEARLRTAVQQLEGVFVEQLLKAMRETVPEGGLVDGGAGEEMFTGMMDQHLAAEVPTRWSSELGDALYRQMRAAMAASSERETTPETAVQENR